MWKVVKKMDQVIIYAESSVRKGICYVCLVFLMHKSLICRGDEPRMFLGSTRNLIASPRAPNNIPSLIFHSENRTYPRLPNECITFADINASRLYVIIYA